jgi:CheY-like chemotaxis protein
LSIRGIDMKKLAVVVDDNQLIRNLLKNFLESLGYETKIYESPLHMPCVKDHSEDHCQFEDGPPDVMITDIKMPGMSGSEFLLNSRSRGCQVKKVAVMSGYWTDEDYKIANQFNCKTLKKPFSLQEISDWVNE